MATGMPFTASASAGLRIDAKDPASNVLPPIVMTYSGQTYAVSGRVATGISPSGQSTSVSSKWYESRGVVLALSVVLLIVAAIAAWRIFRNEHTS